MQQEIESLLQKAIDKLSDQDGLSFPKLPITLEHPRDPSHGDFSCNIAMILAKSVSIAPRILAERLLACIPPHADIIKMDVAGPGFINFTLSNERLQTQFSTIANSPHCGVEPITDQPIVVIDYSSPNLAKEMHVGHLRSTIIGDAIARVLEIKGHRVIRQNHVGDWGTQFGMLLAHLDEENNHTESVKLKDLEQFYKAAKQRFDNDPLFADRARQWVVQLQSGDPHCHKLWQNFIDLSISHSQTLYDRLGVSLKPEHVRGESTYNDRLNDIIASLQQQNLITENEGAKCVFLDEFKGKNNEPLPVIVQKKDGGFLYASTDLAAIQYRQTVLKANRVLYVVDARQSLHFQQIFSLAKKAGFAANTMQLEHISFGMVLDKSGKPFKSREGDVTKLADLLDEAENRAKALLQTKQTRAHPLDELDTMAKVLGISSVKYADLSKNRTSDYIFDWDSMLSFEGNTAPYLLYAYTRINSVFEKAGVTFESLSDHLIFQDAMDKTLAKKIVLFPKIIDMVATRAMPHLLCTYLYELAGLFSSFYEACPILNQNDLSLRESRLKLIGVTGRVLKLGLSLLGITTLIRM